MNQKLYVAWQCHMGHRMAPMVAASHSEGLQRLHQRMHQATQDSWILWAQGLGGTVVVLSGTEGVVAVPPRGLPQVVKQRQRFQEMMGERGVAVGIGSSVEKALRAREFAAKRGRDAPVLWSQEIETSLAQEDPSQGLQKADAANSGAHGGFAGFSRSPPAIAPAAPAKEASEHSEGEAARAEAFDRSSVPPPPEMTHAATDLVDSLHEVAGQTEGKDQQADDSAAKDLSATKKKIAEVLMQVKQQAPMLGQLKAAAPDAYASVEALIESVIALARAIPAVKKSEPDVMDGVSDAEAQQLADDLKVDLQKIPFEEWKKGVQHEREHADVSTDATEIAKIALAHLKENPKYYSDLENYMPMEKEPFKPLSTSGLPMPKTAQRHHLNLPVGTMLQGGPGADRRRVGKIKVAHGDGSVSWISARAGMVTGVADRNAKPILGHAGHPLSSRNTGGR